MVGEASEPYQHFPVLKSRNAIADHFGGIRWHGRANCSVHLVKGGSCGKRRACKVFVDALRSGLAFRLRLAIDRFPFVHPEMLQEFPAASHLKKTT